MPLLDRSGSKQDVWRRGEAAAGQHALVPFAALADVATNARLGVEIPNTVRLDDLEPWFDRLDLIAIAFPSFGDGRGFSIARTLRNAGFKGTLRAVGPLIPDQFAYALACGFDELELPEGVATRAPVEQYVKALGVIHANYQRGYAPAGASILERRRAAQAGKG